MTTMYAGDPHLELGGTTLAGSEFAAQRYDGHMDWDGGGFWVMLSFMAVFWLGLLALVAWAVSTYARRDKVGVDSPLEIVRRRYARGEITAEEFERMKRDIA